MLPTLFHIGPLPLHSFGLMMVLCFVSAWRRFYLSLEAANKRAELAERIITWAAVGGIIGARLGYLVSFPSELLSHPITTLFGSAGFVYHWGFVGGVLSTYLLLAREKEDFMSYADLAGPALAIGYGVGRIGCQLSGDGDYGMPSTLPWAMAYSTGVVPTPPGMLVHPTPIYETIGAFFVAAILLSPRVKSLFHKKGQMFGLYLLMSAVLRFLVEMVRIEPVVFPPFTQAQVMSIGLSAFAFLLLFCRLPLAQQSVRE